MNDNETIVFENQSFAKSCSLFPSQLGCSYLSSQFGTEKEHRLQKNEMLDITKLPIISCKYQFIRQLLEYFINFETIILTVYCEKKYQKRCSQTVKSPS